MAGLLFLCYAYTMNISEAIAIGLWSGIVAAVTVVIAVVAVIYLRQAGAEKREDRYKKFHEEHEKDGE